MKNYKHALFIFRRDLRLPDNSGLIAALKNAEKVSCCFIFNPQQVSEKNEYRSMNSIQFMIESLNELHDEIERKEGRLQFFYGEPGEVLDSILSHEKIDAVFTNRDYTPFSIKRDTKLEHLCNQHRVAWHQYDDIMLNAPEAILTGNRTPYSKFTPYFKRCSMFAVAEPQQLPSGNFSAKKLKDAQSAALFKEIITIKNPDLHVHGGRSNSAKILKHLENFKEYATDRNFPSIASSGLSAYIKFGTHSIREIYWTIHNHLGKHHPMIAQLYWHDFYTQAAFHSPFVFGEPAIEKYKNLPWNSSSSVFKKWCEGNTGFPIVDAGMRQLNTTGFMHNRVRMIVASFLIKDLHVDWRKGEKYFAQHLVDYDPCINNGNWQWAASTGYDAQPYFRIFNPWLQQAKFDPECEYIKRWVPELKKLSPKVIHNWYKTHSPIVADYHAPIVDHAEESKKAIIAYKHAK